MKIHIAIFFSVLVVLVQTPAGQLLKLPLLFEHYIKHQKQERVSFFDFLEDHYSSSHEDADLPEDEQLPFKNITLSSIGYAIVPGLIRSNEIIPLPRDKSFFFRNTYTPQQHSGSIFHPPRVS